ncbi:MAG: hybrid sensor histidine kinase/response regulator [Candidatus Krumholzibacteriia bacterium]
MNDSAPRTILVIDDSPPTCLYLQRLLERKGYRVLLAHDGETGARLAMELLPDLILLDKELPGMHGFDVSRILRRYHDTSYIPILMISSESAVQERIRGLDMGADDFIPKGIAAGELDSKIRAFLRIKELQDALRTERDKLEQIFRFLHEPVAICDREDRLVLASQVFMSLFRLPREVMHFQSFSAILAAVGVPEPLVTQLRAGTREEVRLAVALDEEPVILTARSAPIMLARDDEAMAYIFQDITEKVADERMRADFHSMIAHDLRSPLSVIHGYVSLLATGKAGPVNGVQQDFLTSVQGKVGELTELLNDFLDVSKLDAGFVNLKRDEVELADLVRSVVADLGFLAADRAIGIEVDAMAGVRVDADPLRLKQILTNLLSNAIKYNEEGGWIRIAAECRPVRTPGPAGPAEPSAATSQTESPRSLADARDVAVITVADGGIGIPPEDLAELFHPYQRARQARHIKGVGLGLVIVKKLVEAHGGTVQVTSRPGAGSVFTLTVPLAAAGEPSPGDLAGSGPAASATGKTGPRTTPDPRAAVR